MLLKQTGLNGKKIHHLELLRLENDRTFIELIRFPRVVDHLKDRVPGKMTPGKKSPGKKPPRKLRQEN